MHLFQKLQFRHICSQIFETFSQTKLTQAVRTLVRRGREARYGEKRKFSQVCKSSPSVSHHKTSNREVYTRVFQQAKQTVKLSQMVRRRWTASSRSPRRRWTPFSRNPGQPLGWSQKSRRWLGGRKDDFAKMFAEK